ncbi:MAG: TIGR01777 family oxidoreductase [Planctomycetota bacterium]
MPDSSDQPTIVITGASGLIGTKLTKAFEADGKRVLRAVRREAKNDQELSWNPTTGDIDRDKLEGVDAVVHLAGAGIADRRWSESYKQLILDSRVDGTTLIAETIAGLDRKPRIFACASAIGYYGDRGNAELEESAACGDGYLPEVCMQWERACEKATDAGIRTINMRIGVVLSTEGGALKEMLTPFKLGGGGILGSGKQYFSWIELSDIVRAMQFIVDSDSLSGPVNLVSPNPVTNREFTKTLGRVLSRPTILPMPAFAARLLFGEMADALLLASTRVVPSALTAAGFSYQFGDLEPALRHILSRG